MTDEVFVRELLFIVKLPRIFMSLFFTSKMLTSPDTFFIVFDVMFTLVPALDENFDCKPLLNRLLLSTVFELIPKLPDSRLNCPLFFTTELFNVELSMLMPLLILNSPLFSMTELGEVTF